MPPPSSVKIVLIILGCAAFSILGWRMALGGITSGVMWLPDKFSDEWHSFERLKQPVGYWGLLAFFACASTFFTIGAIAWIMRLFRGK